MMKFDEMERFFFCVQMQPLNMKVKFYWSVLGCPIRPSTR